ncbi:MAG: hypothetical protein WCO63_10700 [Bacteroidota bacterium]
MKTWLKVILGLAVLGIIALVYVYFFMFNKAHTDFEKAKAEYSLKSEELYKSYKTDTATANPKFNGKVLEISGNVDTVEVHNDTLCVAVFSCEQGMFGPQGIRCSFLKKFNEGAKKLKSKQAVKIKGVCQGYNDTDVILESASIVE